ncbi:MAG: conjugal transfer protein TraF [Endomicrobia bacterium]|nr:conjugal transfer protein TraF [Endomicrobiia bacterium]
MIIVKILFYIFIFTNLSFTYTLINKPLSLAKAYTAYNGDIYSLSTNPAGLYGGKMVDVKIDLLANINFTGDILYNINNIVSTFQAFQKIEKAQQEGTAIDITQIASLFNGIKNLIEIDKPGKGVLFAFNGGVGVKVKNFGVSIRNITNVGLKPRIDSTFNLGSTNVSVSSSPLIYNLNKVMNFSPEEQNSPKGITLTTDTLKYGNLVSLRDDLKNNVLPWLVNELEKMNIEIPDEVKNNLDGLANALINYAVDNGVKEEEIENSIKLLKDPDLQNIISNILQKVSNSPNQTFVDNNSGVVLKGINCTEICLGYSYSVIKNLQLGLAVKYLIGKTIYYNFKVFQEKEKIDLKDISSLEGKLIRNSQAIGVDVGAIYKLPLPAIDTNIGIVIKNLIEPTFYLPSTDEKLKFSRQLRVGISGNINIIKFGLDIDLNRVDTFVSGYYTQDLSLGVELDPPFLPSLRLGYLRNLTRNDDQFFSVGLGMKLFFVNFDLIGAFNPKQTKIDNKFSLPVNNLFIGLTVGAAF